MIKKCFFLFFFLIIEFLSLVAFKLFFQEFQITTIEPDIIAIILSLIICVFLSFFPMLFELECDTQFVKIIEWVFAIISFFVLSIYISFIVIHVTSDKSDIISKNSDSISYSIKSTNGKADILKSKNKNYVFVQADASFEKNLSYQKLNGCLLYPISNSNADEIQKYNQLWSNVSAKVDIKYKLTVETISVNPKITWYRINPLCNHLKMSTKNSSAKITKFSIQLSHS